MKQNNNLQYSRSLTNNMQLFEFRVCFPIKFKYQLYIISKLRRL